MINRLKCSRCGAEQEIASDIIGIKCEYCGEPIINIPDKYLKVLKCPKTIPHEEALTNIRKFLLERVGRGYSIHNIIKFCIPIWRGIVEGRFRYIGYKKHIVTKTIKTKRGTRVKTETYYIPVDKTIQVHEKIAVPGRINKDIYALDEVLDNSIHISKYDNIENLVDKGWEIVIPELSYDEAANRLDDEIEERLYRNASNDVDELFDYDAELSVTSIDLVYYPVVEFTYLFKNKRYRGVFDPTRREILRCEIPMKRIKRIIYGAVAYLISLFTGYVSLSTTALSNSGAVAPLLIGIIAGGMGAYALYKATSPQEVYD